MYYNVIMPAANPEAVSEKWGKVTADAFYAAFSAFLFGVCLAGTIRQFDSLYFSGALVCGAFAILAVWRTQHAIRRLTTAKYTTSDSARRSARQLSLFCICFAVSSMTFGAEMTAAVRNSSDVYYSYGAVFWALISGVWIFCVRREARRLASALV
jgi:hypothetical protein